MKWIIACFAIVFLFACDKEPVPAPATPAVDAAPAPPAPDREAPQVRPDVGGGGNKTPASPPSGAPGILPEPDFKLAGPNLKAPTSAPADGDSQPRLLNLDLKKE